MKSNEIVTVYVAFANGQGGKRRPILVVEDKEERVAFFSITTKYEKKSEAIKNLYYPIRDWKEAGLHKQSWIDVGTLRGISRIRKDITFKKVGKLTTTDKKMLNDFIEKLIPNSDEKN
ncbi:type II toxin-antitoxin system PemK/MazF family toxin [Enterococcus hulanensis]|uniref:type II toxin-antitoxin system PemK/MazF family toxin n=1 Tax=Enterococcus hulanensis TaxID=2559929 RepID=UPI001A8F56EB|nr:type II toxin-antitoxin system PemK/MazF family toxin [Enterococcus hulanensis]MBO0457062.1 type II toxin-antitoxin system PemK/MazF family toxin [Enterococcus hulanensis]